MYIRSEARVLHGLFRVPPRARGVVLLLQERDSGGDLARRLAGAGIASLAVNLSATEQSEDEIRDPAMRCVDGLCSRLFDVTLWVRGRRETRALPLCYVAEGLSAAGAVIEAARQPGLVRGIVLRDAALNAAGPWLPRLRSPVLLAGRDTGPDALVVWLAQRLGEGDTARESPAPIPATGESPLRSRCIRGARRRGCPARETARPSFAR